MLNFTNKSARKIFNKQYFVSKQCCQKFSTASPLTDTTQHEANFQSVWANAKQYKSIPGPSIVGLMARFMPGGKYHKLDMVGMHRSIRDEYGTIAKFPGILGNREIVMVLDSDHFETVYRNEGVWPYRLGIATFEHYRKKIRPDVFKNMGGLISEQGEPWAKMRSSVSPIMLKPATVNAYIPSVDEIAIEFCDRIKTLRDDKLELPPKFMHELNRWALETIASIGLDQRLHILDGSKGVKNKRAMELIKAVDDFFTLSFELEMLPSLWRYIATPKYTELMKVFDTMTEATLYFIDQAIENLEKKPVESNQHREPSVLEKLLKIDKHVAIVMALDMLLAGVDTTSASVANILYQLAKNPDKQEILRQELGNCKLDSNGILTPSSFLTAPYLRATLKEVLRLSPITAGNVRAVARDVVIQGYKIPKGTNVAMTNMLLHHDEKHFKDPSKFMPERWLKESMPNACPEAKASNPFVFLPFGFGPRSCVGRRFAEMEMSVLLTRLLTKYHVEFNYEPLKYRYSFVMSPTSELKFKLTEI